MTAAAQFRPSTKKVRGLSRKTLDLRSVILTTFDETDKPVTVRQMFYMLTVRGAVEKEESGYRRTARQLLQMRRADLIPYGWIADNTRWMRKPRTYSNLEQFLRDGQALYRRDVWRRLPVHVEVWTEKDTLAGVLYDVTALYDVPLYPARGYSSETFAFGASEYIQSTGKKGIIYYIGDFDPSGWQMAENLEAKLRSFGADIEFHRLAVNPDQVLLMNLPTRPTKTTDTRCKAFYDRFGKGTPSAEAEAIPPDVLRQIVREAIEQHIPKGHLKRLAVAEESERDILGRMAAIAAGGAG